MCMHAYILLLVYLLLSYPRSMASLFITAFSMMSEVDDNFHDSVVFLNLVFNGNRDASQHKLYYDLGDVLKLIKNGNSEENSVHAVSHRAGHFTYSFPMVALCESAILKKNFL